MRKKKPEPEPEIVRFSNVAGPVVPGFTICNLSEADVKELNAGRVPDWIIHTTDIYLSGWPIKVRDDVSH